MILLSTRVAGHERPASEGRPVREKPLDFVAAPVVVSIFQTPTSGHHPGPRR